MWYSKNDGQYIQEGQQFVIDGVTYPAQWLNQSTAEQKAAIGLEEVVATNSPASDKYYWVSQNLKGATLTYVNTPKDLDACKVNDVAQANATAYSILLPSDYMAGKAFETGTTIPEAWATWRESVRQTARNAVSSINAATSVEELEAISIDWPHDPDYVEPVVEPIEE